MQRLINLSLCENKVLSLKFSSLTSMIIHMPFLMFRFAVTVRVHGSLRTVAKQLSVNAKDLCDISFVSTWSIRRF